MHTSVSRNPHFRLSDEGAIRLRNPQRIVEMIQEILQLFVGNILGQAIVVPLPHLRVAKWLSIFIRNAEKQGSCELVCFPVEKTAN